MPWVLLLLFALFSAPLQAVTIPGVTPSTASDASQTPAQEPDLAQKKAAYAALADVLENDASRKELIDQLRQAAATPPAEQVPKITPPEVTEQKTVLENVTDLSRHYGEQLSSRFAQLWRNITGSPHKPFNPQTFTSALTHFLLLAALVFAIYGALRLCALPLYRKMGQWGRRKNRERNNWLQLPSMIVGAFIIDLMLLALTLFIGQMLSDNLNAGSRTIAFQQSLFLNAFALIEFFKAILRLIFCPRVADLRPFNTQDDVARYWNLRLSALSSLIGYGLIVAVPIISNQINVQVGALANVAIMLVITLWALRLIFSNKQHITRSLQQLADHSLPFFSLFIRAFALVWHWVASAYFIVLFFFSLFDPGNSLKFMMGATVRSLAIISIAAFASGILSRWIAKTITLSPETQRNYPELQKRLNGWISGSLKFARFLIVCVAVMLMLSAWGLFDFWQWLHYGAGEKTVDILIRIALILFFSAVGWTVLASLIENRLASDIHGRPLPSARTRTLLTLFRNALAVVISTITVMIVLSEIGVNIAPLLAGAGALGLAISFGAQTLVKDIITGIFIQFENGMNTGDLVTIGPLTGTVERMSIRSVGVRQDTGAYHIIPWSSITTFANFVRGIGSVVANYDVDRHEDTDKANQALKDAVAELMEQEAIRGLIIGEPSFAGLVGLTNTAFTLRVSFT
ncbi:mechanosensitive channel protein, partial [Trabulsiella odontotermitis]